MVASASAPGPEVVLLFVASSSSEEDEDGSSPQSLAVASVHSDDTLLRRCSTIAHAHVLVGCFWSRMLQRNNALLLLLLIVVLVAAATAATVRVLDVVVVTNLTPCLAGNEKADEKDGMERTRTRTITTKRRLCRNIVVVVVVTVVIVVTIDSNNF